MTDKKRNPLRIANLISVIICGISVVLWLVLCIANVWIGLTLLYTLLPAALGIMVITFIVTAIIDATRKKEQEAPVSTISHSSEQPQKQIFCPNCGTPQSADQKQCVNCAYEL
ncbi:MAG: zinc ribbon domain-containing protein [Asgard group archaeon]|nr:zinc ribbon domain-containing protein [Asgard group archaeon]